MLVDYLNEPLDIFLVLFLFVWFFRERSGRVDDYFTGDSLNIEAIADFSPQILFFPPDKPCQPDRARAGIDLLGLGAAPYRTVNQRYSRHPLIYRLCIQYIMSIGDRTSPLPLMRIIGANDPLVDFAWEGIRPKRKKDLTIDVPTHSITRYDYPPPWHLAPLGHHRHHPLPLLSLRNNPRFFYNEPTF